MKTLSIFAVLALMCGVGLAGCGGSNPAPTLIEQPAPPPGVALQPPQFGLVLYVGDEETAYSCDASYMGQYWTFVKDVPNGACSTVAGETSKQTLARFSQILSRKPNVIVLMIGLNDIRQNSDQGTTYVWDMVSLAKSAGVTVVLATLPQSKGFEDQIRAWNVSIRQIVQAYGTQLADYEAALLDPTLSNAQDFYPGINALPMMDAEGAYPSPAGYQVMWNIVCEPLDADHEFLDGSGAS